MNSTLQLSDIVCRQHEIYVLKHEGGEEQRVDLEAKREAAAKRQAFYRTKIARMRDREAKRHGYINDVYSDDTGNADTAWNGASLVGVERDLYDRYSVRLSEVDTEIDCLDSELRKLAGEQVDLSNQLVMSRRVVRDVFKSNGYFFDVYDDATGTADMAWDDVVSQVQPPTKNSTTY